MFNVYTDFFSDGPLRQSIDVLFEQYVGNQVVSQQQISAPAMMLQSQFMQACRQITGQSPMKIKMTRWEEIWDQAERKTKPVEYSVEFQNWRDE